MLRQAQHHSSNTSRFNLTEDFSDLMLNLSKHL